MNTSKEAVNDYLNAMFMDVTLTESVDESIQSEAEYQLQPIDSIQNGSRVIACMDPFQLMTLKDGSHASHLWLACLVLIELIQNLPEGAVRSYCVKQCQILMSQWRSSR